jgi:hypothetical protein
MDSDVPAAAPRPTSQRLRAMNALGSVSLAPAADRVSSRLVLTGQRRQIFAGRHAEPSARSKPVMADEHNDNPSS